jgi:PAS domain S-box-containing protein
VRWSKAEAANEAFFALQEAARGYAVIATDADGDIRSLSPGAGQLFGWEEDAVVGRNASLLFDEAAWKDLIPKLARRSLRERGVETRSTMARRDGSRFHARLTVRLLRGHSDEPSGFLLVVQDVTELVKVEGELRAAERRSRGILDSLPGGIAIVSEGRIVYANPGMRSLLDVPLGEIDGFPLRERVATSHVLVVQDALMRLSREGGDAAAEETVTLVDGEGRDRRNVRFVAVRHEHDGRPAVLVFLRDETAERRTLRTLAAQEARLDAVLDSWDDAVLLVEGDGPAARVRVANEAFVEMFGLNRADVVGIKEDDLQPLLSARGPEGEAAAACLTAAERSSPTGDTVSTDARTLFFRAVSLAHPQAGEPMRMLVVRDVTEERVFAATKSEEVEQWKNRHEAAVARYAELKKLHDELEAGRTAAEALNSELRTLDQMKSDLLANVSHELQTPLVSIRGYTEMISKGRLGPINEEQRKGLALSLKNIDRLIAMIDNLLAFARADRDSSALNITTFALLPLIDEAVALLGPRIDAKQLRVTRQVDDPNLTVRADRDKILQVFLNLIGNAVKFNRDRGSIDVSARRGKPGFALVQVGDTGPGIAKDDLERIFDRFYRAGETEAKPAEGSGIGLAIVRNILRLHGCVIHASSEPGEGTVLSFTLPIEGERIERAPAPPVELEPPEPKEEPEAPAPPRRIEPEPRRSEPAARSGPKAAAERPRLRIIRRG